MPNIMWYSETDTVAKEEEVEADINDPAVDELLYGPDDCLDADENWSNNLIMIIAAFHVKIHCLKMLCKNEPFGHMQLCITL